MVADTEYTYSICVGARLLVTASFRTLHEAPKQLHLLTISDTQIFRPHEAFTAMTKEERNRAIEDFVARQERLLDISD